MTVRGSLHTTDNCDETTRDEYMWVRWEDRAPCLRYACEATRLHSDISVFLCYMYRYTRGRANLKVNAGDRRDV